jgi:GDPmannose 4,6-dehydratase
LYATNGVLFNHESERRGETFMTRKITRAATRIAFGLQDKLYLGNLDAKRDRGHARDYVRAMWLILQHDTPDDFVVATGEMYSVREFVQKVFATLDLNWEDHVEVDPRYFRPAEVEALQGDASKARDLLGWEPTVDIDQLVRFMVSSDLVLAEQEKILLDAGHVVAPRAGTST